MQLQIEKNSERTLSREAKVQGWVSNYLLFFLFWKGKIKLIFMAYLDPQTKTHAHQHSKKMFYFLFSYVKEVWPNIGSMLDVSQASMLNCWIVTSIVCFYFTIRI